MRWRIGNKIVKRLLSKGCVKGVDSDPYDRRLCEQLADKLFNELVDDSPSGSIQRNRIILQIIGDSFPTERLTTEYFANLELVLRGRRRRETPGQLVLGLGTGRCGSTSLAGVLGTVTDSCCTHENPPLIFWKPEPEQIDFHIRRFNILTEYYPLVADVSHWWLNSTRRIFERFPSVKIIGLIRDSEACAESFMRIKGYGFGTYNHWAPPGNGLWCSAHWDPTYPTFDLPAHSARIRMVPSLNLLIVMFETITLSLKP